jgi:hypothetical protein
VTAKLQHFEYERLKEPNASPLGVVIIDRAGTFSRDFSNPLLNARVAIDWRYIALPVMTREQQQGARSLS